VPSISELTRKAAEGLDAIREISRLQSRSSNFTQVPRDWVKACEEARLAGYTTPMEWALAEFEKGTAEKQSRAPNINREFLPGDELANLRGRLCHEEGYEVWVASDEGSLANVAKETSDMDYVSIGTKVAYGIPYWETFWLVHENNMRKIETGTVNEYGKLVKSKDHPKVDLTGVVRTAEENQRNG
jgi:hypothetical protein